MANETRVVPDFAPEMRTLGAKLLNAADALDQLRRGQLVEVPTDPQSCANLRFVLQDVVAHARLFEPMLETMQHTIQSIREDERGGPAPA